MRLRVPGPPELQTRRRELPQNGNSLSARSSGPVCRVQTTTVSSLLSKCRVSMYSISYPLRSRRRTSCLRRFSVVRRVFMCRTPVLCISQLLTSGGNDGPRAGSTPEVRKWAGPGCSRRGSSSDLRMLRAGPAVTCVPQPRAARREAGLNWRDLGRPYNGRISEDFSLSVLFTEHAFRQRERRHAGAMCEPTIELAHRIRYSSKTPPRRRHGGELAVVSQ